MKKGKIISLVLLMFLICVLILSPSVAAQVSDPQEAIIKRVLRETGAVFGWDQRACFDIEDVNGEPHRHCPEIQGPKRLYNYEGGELVKGACVGYFLLVPFRKGDWVEAGLVIKIVAHPTETAAEAVIAEGFSFSGTSFVKATKFHNRSAIIDTATSGRGIVEWQSGRFYFSMLGNAKRNAMTIAEALYANAVKHRLIGGEVVEGVAFSIKVQAPGYLPWSDTLATKDYKPSSITLKGVVKDEDGNPVSGATISIPDLGKSVTSGVEGNYKLYVPTEGTKQFSKARNIILQKKVTGTNIKIETEKILPVPGEVTITITALDQDGKPFKGIVDITVVDKNNKQIYFTELEKATGFMLDDNGKYSTKLKIRDPRENVIMWSAYYKTLRDILTATIRVGVLYKELNIIGKAEKTVPFNLAIIHGVMVDKDLNPVQCHVSDVLGIQDIMVLNTLSIPQVNGDFWVMVKPNHPQNKRSIQDFMNLGNDFALKLRASDKIPLVYSIEDAPKPGEVLELGKVGKTPLEKIKEWYKKFGTTSHTWPDGTTDEKALSGPIHPQMDGVDYNFACEMLHCDECCRFSCVAMQYKTLWFLNNLKNKKADDENAKFLSKLKGWDYSAVDGNWFTPGKKPWNDERTTEHNAVALWDRGKWNDHGSWTIPPTGSGVIILDPHGRQEAHWYSADTNFFPWTIERSVEKLHEGSGWKPQWPKPKVKPPKTVAAKVKCPVDVLIVNSQGHRLGVFPNGDKVAEFEPIDFYFWKDEKGDKQWFFVLPQDTYEIELLGTGSGNFHLLTYPSGEEIHDYGDNPIAAGEQATLTMNPEGDELTLANGKEVMPTIIKLPLKPTDTGGNLTTTSTGGMDAGGDASKLSNAVKQGVIAGKEKEEAEKLDPDNKEIVKTLESMGRQKDEWQSLRPKTSPPPITKNPQPAPQRPSSDDGWAPIGGSGSSMQDKSGNSGGERSIPKGHSTRYGF